MESEFLPEIQEKELPHERTRYDGVKELVKYKLGPIIGEGGFSKCYKCFGIGKGKKKIYAAKELNRKTPEEITINEILIYNNLECENIIKLKDYFNYNSNSYLIFEYCENKDLYSLLKKRIKLKEIEVQYYMQQLIKALIHLHENNIIHRDLKLQNIFLTDKLELRLGDLGLAKKLSYQDSECYNTVGTIYYMAPELLEKKPYSFAADIWSIGVIMYNLIIGYPPFKGKDKSETKEKIINVNYEFPDNAIISNAAKDLIKQILVYEPDQRPNLLQILEHNFFKLGNSIPKKLPKNFIRDPPSISYIRNFMEDADENGIVNKEVTTTNLKDIIIKKSKELITEINNNNEHDIYVVQCRIIKKYGLGYVLSNNSYGVCFNDNSKIIMNQGDNKFFYVENKKDGNYYKINDPNLRIDIQKKYCILQGFVNIFNYYNKDSLQKKINTHYERKNNEISLGDPIYVKQFYVFDNESILLRMNNKTIHIYFYNEEKFILSKDVKEVTFIRKDRNNLYRNNYKVDKIFDTKNFELIRKLQYFESLLLLEKFIN